MCPSNGAETAGLEFTDYGSTTFDNNCFTSIIEGLPSLGDPCVDLSQIQSPSMFLFAEELDGLVTGCDDFKDSMQLETNLPATLSQTGAAEDRTYPTGVIPLTVLEIDDDDAASASPESTSSTTDDALSTSLYVPDNNRRVRGVVRHSKSQGSSDEPKPTKARHFSVTLPLKSPTFFCGPGNSETVSGQSVRSQVSDATNRDPGPPWPLELRNGENAAIDVQYFRENSGNQMTAKPLTEMSSDEVPDVKLERRRAQNRKAANRCRNKRKQEEDQLKKDFEFTEKDNQLKRREIQELASQIKRLKAELHRHESTDPCYLQAPPHF